MEVKLLTGDLLICYDSSLKLALGITHHVELKQQGAIQKSVVELCRGQVSLLQQTGPVAETKIQALLLEYEAKHELFLASGIVYVHVHVYGHNTKTRARTRERTRERN